MGNALASSPCLNLNLKGSRSREIKLIFWDGTTRVTTGKHVAGEIMFEFPDMIVCHADSFFIGHPVPVLAIEDVLVPGESYFIVPIDCFRSIGPLSASSLAALGSNSPNNNGKRSPVRNGFGEGRPFEYMKDEDGKVMIKVVPEFIARLIIKELNQVTSSSSTTDQSVSPSHAMLCSTPELQKHYDQLVGMNKEQVWSPKLETITEHKLRFSPCRFIGLEWKQKEGS